MGDSGILYTTTIKILPEWKETTSDDPDVLPFKTRAACFSLSVDGSTLPSLHDEEGLLVMAAWLHRPLQFLSRIPGDDDDDDYDSADDKRDDDDDDDDVEENNDPDPDSMSLDTEEKDSDGSSNNTSHKSEADDEDIFEDVKVIRDPLSPRKLLDQIKKKFACYQDFFMHSYLGSRSIPKLAMNHMNSQKFWHLLWLQM